MSPNTKPCKTIGKTNKTNKTYVLRRCVGLNQNIISKHWFYLFYLVFQWFYKVLCSETLVFHRFYLVFSLSHYLSSFERQSQSQGTSQGKGQRQKRTEIHCWLAGWHAEGLRPKY